MRDLGNDLHLAYFADDASRMVTLTREQRAKHLLLLGVPGSGKSKLMEHMFIADARAWPYSRCGAMLLDPQGNLFDAIMHTFAATGFNGSPIIPIDLTRSDYVVSYDLLRRRTGGDPATYIHGLIDGILHSFGQGSTSDTPRLAKMLEAVFFMLYERERPLSDALRIVSEPHLRNELVRGVEHVVTRSVWASLKHLSEAQLIEHTDSFSNRIRRFLSTELMRTMLCQGGNSLDLGTAIRDGQIILVNLSTSGNNIKSEDARALGSLLISDVWTAAQARGATGQIKPFYCYVDEAQLYLTPAIAETLDQGRKFGVHFTFAMQFPSQALHAGPCGERVYDSLMANCRSKICFQLEHGDDLESLARWFARHELDPMIVKDEIHSTKVIDHKLVYLPSVSKGTSTTESKSNQWSHSDQESQTKSFNWSHTDAHNEAHTESLGTSEADNETHSESTEDSGSHGESQSLATAHTAGATKSKGRSKSKANSYSETDGWNAGTADGTTQSESRGGGTSTQRGRSQTRGLGKPTRQSQQALRDERLRARGQTQSGTVGRSQKPQQFSEKFHAYRGENRRAERDREEFERQHVSDIAIGENETVGDTSNWSETTQQSRQSNQGRSGSRARSETESQADSESDSASQANSLALQDATSIQTGRSKGQAHAQGKTRGVSFTLATTVADSEAETYGEGEAVTNGTSDTVGGSVTAAAGSSEGVTLSPMLLPIMGEELSSRTYLTIDEQLHLWMQRIAGQTDRHCIARFAGTTRPVQLVTKTIKRIPTTAAWIEQWTLKRLQTLQCALPRAAALQQVTLREAWSRQSDAHFEPQTVRRKLPNHLSR